MRVVVTGGSGFVGRHVLAALAAKDHVALPLGGPHDRGTMPSADIRDADALEAAIGDLAPDILIHLAGNAFVPDARAHPLDALATNGMGAANVLEAVRRYRDRSGRACRVVLGGSAAVYGPQPEERMPLNEQTAFLANDPYGATKIAAEAFALAWRGAYGIDVVLARLFNAIGAGQDTRFVVASFASQLAKIAVGAESIMHVGNIESVRDFLDVRDVATAYVALAERGTGGEAYNICSGKPTAIREILRQLIMIARVPVEVREDPERMRASDTPILYGDATKLRTETSWAPQYALADSLREVYADARERVAAVRA